MKFLKIILLGLVSILLFNTNLKSQDCEDGFSSATFTVPLGKNNCNYEVVVCYACTTGTHLEGIVKIWSITPWDPECDPDPLADETAVIDAIQDYI